jgi:hypothetical protein
MTHATASTITSIRVPRGAPRPTDAEFRAALHRDRERLGVRDPLVEFDMGVAGPYAIFVAGEALDEYVVWEY